MKKLKAVFCALFGHSNITECFFGYHTCARCGAMLGDSLGGAYTNSREVIVGHSCEVCRDNYKKLSWKDKFLAPNPFKKA